MKNHSPLPFAHRRHLRLSLVAAAAAVVASGAGAAQIDVANPDLALRWDNTVKASTIYRLHNADSSLTDASYPDGRTDALNLNAGDQNFRKRGFVSERLDLLSEFDAVYRRNFGLRISGAAWYDAAYRGTTDAPNDPVNGQSPYNRFNAETRNLAGHKAEFLDAFVFGSTELGGAGKLSARLGQHTILYGESLFFGDNGVAAANGPIDILKLLSSPNAQFKEIARPVPQLSTTWQIQPSLSLGAYYQFKWRESRVPPSGSYFSAANIPWGSSSPEYVNVPVFVPGIGGAYTARHGADELPGNSGQYGMQVKWRVAETDLGFYAARYNDTFGQLYTQVDPGAKTTGSHYNYVFGKNIRVYGISASRSVGDFNLSGEVSVRDNAALVVNNAVSFVPAGTPRDPYPTGRTLHLNISALASFGPNFIAQESGFVGEFAWNRRMTLNDPGNHIDQGRTRDASAIQFIYTPTYRQVSPGLDLSVPIGVRYNIDGRSSVTAWGPHGTGNANIGIEGNYLNVWQFALNFTHYLGDSLPTQDYNDGPVGRFSGGNPLRDRDYLSFNVRRTF